MDLPLKHLSRRREGISAAPGYQRNIPGLRPRSGGDRAVQNADQKVDETDELPRRFVQNGPLTGQLPTLSHPFIERLIGTIRREYLDHTLFWNAIDLKRKLSDFQRYYNHHRTHSSLGGDTPAEFAAATLKSPIKLDNFNWQHHCPGRYQLPIAA